ncbi:MAG: C69 family dipeptidase [Thermodesulfobacteriota bacterium]
MERIIALVLLLIMGGGLSSEACTTIIVGKKATQDRSILIARNEDALGADEPQNMILHPAGKGKTVFRSNLIENFNASSFSSPLPGNALAYTSFPLWRTGGQSNYSFEETGINAYGVALSATETLFNSERVLKIDPYNTRTGITEDAITSVILPYAASAREGVRLLGGIIEKNGAGEGFGVAISDRNEVWYLETASGHHWLAMKIPEEAYFVSANQGRFQEADISDIMNVLSSPGLLDFAVSHRLFDPQKEPFNFFKCFISNTSPDRTYNYPRVQTLLRLYSGYDGEGDQGLFPVFPTPKKKLSVWDVARGLRNKFNGTPYDPYQTQNPKAPFRPICVMRTSLSHITQTRPDLPQDIAVVQYIALGMTDLSAYIPFYQGITAVPKAYQGARDRMDGESLFWQYRKMQALVLQDYPRLAFRAHAAIAKLEKAISEDQKKVEKKYFHLYEKDLQRARALIQEFTEKNVGKQKKMLGKLISELEKILGLPKMTHIEYTDLIKKTEAQYHFHGA